MEGRKRSFYDVPDTARHSPMLSPLTLATMTILGISAPIMLRRKLRPRDAK